MRKEGGGGDLAREETTATTNFFIKKFTQNKGKMNNTLLFSLLINNMIWVAGRGNQRHPTNHFLIIIE